MTVQPCVFNSLFPNDTLTGSLIVFRIPNDTLMRNANPPPSSPESHAHGVSDSDCVIGPLSIP